MVLLPLCTFFSLSFACTGSAAQISSAALSSPARSHSSSFFSPLSRLLFIYFDFSFPHSLSLHIHAKASSSRALAALYIYIKLLLCIYVYNIPCSGYSSVSCLIVDDLPPGVFVCVYIQTEEENISWKKKRVIIPILQRNQKR